MAEMVVCNTFTGMLRQLLPNGGQYAMPYSIIVALVADEEAAVNLLAGMCEEAWDYDTGLSIDVLQDGTMHTGGAFGLNTDNTCLYAYTRSNNAEGTDCTAVDVVVGYDDLVVFSSTAEKAEKAKKVDAGMCAKCHKVPGTTKAHVPSVMMFGKHTVELLDVLLCDKCLAEELGDGLLTL